MRLVYGVLCIGTTVRRRYAHRALARLQYEPSPQPTFTPFMPTPLLLRSTRLARVVMTRLYTWARLVLIEVGVEVLTYAHLLTVDLRNRYVSLLLILALLIFSSASARLAHFANEFRDALNRRDFARIKDLAGGVVLLMGEIAVLRLAVFLLDEAVSWFYFYFFGLEYWLIVRWRVAAHFAFVGGIGYSEGDCDAVSVTTATATMGAFAPMYIHRTTRPFITLLAEY